MIKIKKNKTTIVKKTKEVAVAVLIDASGSMSPFTQQIPKVVEEYITTLKNQDAAHGTKTSVCFVTFNNKSEITSLEPVREVSGIEGYRPEGGTAMFDAISEAIDQLNKDTTNDTPKIIAILTDGEENSSRTSSLMINKKIKSCLATDFWTFAFSLPAGGYKTKLQSLVSLPDGCFTEWEQTQAGLENNTRSVARGMGATYSCYAAGQTNNNAGFFPQVAHLTNTMVKKTLNDLTSSFKLVKNTKADRSIAEVWSDKFSGKYVPGDGFYELVKKETVQDFKAIVLKDVQSGKVYGGDEARDLLGIPTGGTIELQPNINPKYRIFVRSTSWNRKIPSGSEVLFICPGKSI